MDRQLIRMNESLESVKTISEVILTLGRWVGLSSSLQNLLITNMESMIHYFKLVTEGYTFGCSETYLRQEAPKGELGCYVLSGIIKPSRMAIRSPDYQNLQALNLFLAVTRLLILSLLQGVLTLYQVHQREALPEAVGDFPISLYLKEIAKEGISSAAVAAATLYNYRYLSGSYPRG